MKRKNTNYLVLLMALVLFTIAVALTVMAGVGLGISLIWNLLASLYVYYGLIPAALVDSPFVLVASLLDAFVFALFAVFLATWFIGLIRRINITEYFILAKVRRLDKHIIVAPYNGFSRALVEELAKEKMNFVAIVQNETQAARLYRQGVLAIVGELKSEEAFKAAGIVKASCIIACDDEDVKNALIAITAKDISPDINVISRVIEEENIQKLARAGASSVVLPGITAGARLGEEILKHVA